MDGNPAPTLRLVRAQAYTKLHKIQGAWLNTIANEPTQTRIEVAGHLHNSTTQTKSGLEWICSNHCLPSSLLWDGHVPVSVRTTVSTGDVSYKHVLESAIPVMDHIHFGNYTLSYNWQTITRITIIPERYIRLPIKIWWMEFRIRDIFINELKRIRFFTFVILNRIKT